MKNFGKLFLTLFILLNCLSCSGDGKDSFKSFLKWKEGRAVNLARETITESRLVEDLQILSHGRMMGRGSLSPETGREFPTLFLAKELDDCGAVPLGGVFSKSDPMGEFKMRSYFQEFPVEKSVVSRNIVGMFWGKNRSETLIICAHYDHLGISEDGKIFYGADDNGSGSSAVLEIARTISEFLRHGGELKRNISIVFFGGEELGLYGSDYFVHNPPEEIKMENVVAVLNLDMVGRNGDKYLYAIGSPYKKEFKEISPMLYEINQRINKEYSFDFDLVSRFAIPQEVAGFPSGTFFSDVFRLSDHYSFYGIAPVVFYFSGEHPDYHTPADTYEKINYPKLKKVVDFVFLVALEVCQSEVRPKYIEK